MLAGDDLIDDVLNKRFGNGYAFYGQRQSDQQKDYDAIAEEAKQIVAAMLRLVNATATKMGREDWIGRSPTGLGPLPGFRTQLASVRASPNHMPEVLRTTRVPRLGIFGNYFLAL